MRECDLGSGAHRRMGGEAADGFVAAEPGRAEHSPMVPDQPASSGLRAALQVESEGTRTLRVLRDHLQHANVEGVSASSATSMAEVAGTPQPSTRDELGPIPAAATALFASVAENRPLLRQAANPCLEEAYGLMRPRTDLWEPWAGNRPGPPVLENRQEHGSFSMFGSEKKKSPARTRPTCTGGRQSDDDRKIPGRKMSR